LFGVLTEAGDTAYTRRGDLVIGGDGTLRIGSGEQLSSDAGGPITVPALTEVKIGSDGTVFGKQVGGEAVVFQPLARIKVVDADPTKVVIRTDGLFESVDRTPFETAATPAVQAGALEGSNVSLFSAMVDMIGMSRRYEMQVKVMKQASDLAERSQSLARLTQ
jgi:flagellar basal-body rod protein FlgF